MTGAPVPVGAEAIVMVEDSQRIGDDRVKLTAKVEANQAIRPAGDDVKKNDTVFRAGDEVNAAVMGMLASMNVATVTVTGQILPGTALSSERIAERFWDLHTMPAPAPVEVIL